MGSFSVGWSHRFSSTSEAIDFIIGRRNCFGRMIYMDINVKENKRKKSVPLVTEKHGRYNKKSTDKSARANQEESAQKQMEALAQEVATKTASELLRQLNLDNRTGESLGVSESEGDDDMPKRLREMITVNGKSRWVTGINMQQLFDNYVQLLEAEGIIAWTGIETEAPLLKDFIQQFYSTYKQNQVETTIISRERVIKNHILPQFGERRINEITTSECQAWINNLNKKYARETILKIKNAIYPVFEAAVEDRLMERNPLNSRFIEIGGRDTVPHKALPKEKMQEIRLGAPMLDKKEKLMVGLLSYTGMRFEEVLGIRWDDINDDWIKIQRAVVHPKRNAPLIKGTKTKTSNRIIPYFQELKDLIEDCRTTGYLLASDKDPTGETPLSYTEARRVFEKIRKRFDIKDYSAHDFRDTCATEWREKGIPLDVIARLLGHAKTDTT